MKAFHHTVLRLRYRADEFQHRAPSVASVQILLAWCRPADGVFRVSGRGMPGGAVTGVPYSAEQVTEHLQTLADGTRITSPLQKVMFLTAIRRDATRTERSFPFYDPGGCGRGCRTEPHRNCRPRERRSLQSRCTQPRSGQNVFSHCNRAPTPARFGNRLRGQSQSTLHRRRWFQRHRFPRRDGQTQRPQFSRESLALRPSRAFWPKDHARPLSYPIRGLWHDRPITTVL